MSTKRVSVMIRLETLHPDVPEETDKDQILAADLEAVVAALPGVHITQTQVGEFFPPPIVPEPEGDEGLPAPMNP